MQSAKKVIGVAVIAFASWATFGPEPRFAFALINAASPRRHVPARARSG